MKNDLEHVIYSGQWIVLDVLLRGWTDDNEVNRAVVEALLAQSMFKMAGID